MASASTGAGNGQAPLGLKCGDHVSDEGVRYRKCEGRVASFDGLPLSTTVTLPADAKPPLPLVVLRHGSHRDKTSYEYEPGETLEPRQQDWNNVALAARGYAVLTSTARGWHDSCGPSDRQRPEFFAAECQGRRYWYHAYDPRWEVRDVQTQIALLADDGWVDPGAVGVYGFSMGAVETWLLALLNNRTMALDGTLSRWRSPAGIPLRIAAAVPEAAFAHPLYGYIPNGRARDDIVPTLEELSRPIGVFIDSWSTPSCAGNAGTAELAPPGADPSADWAGWCARGAQGNPFRYDPTLDPAVVAIVDELEFRAPLRFAPTRPRVPIFLWQGLTDSITTGIHGVLMLNRLRALDPGYPVKAWFDDIGHGPASSTPETYGRIHDAGHAFLAYHLKGEGDPPSYDVTASSPVCASKDGRQLTLTDERWQDLSTDSLTFVSEDDRATASSDGGPWAFTGGRAITWATYTYPCPTTSAAMNTTRASWTFGVEQAFVLAGAPEVTLQYKATGMDPQIAVRLWDVEPGGSTHKLISRGNYRQEGVASAATLTTSFQLWPQVWRLQEGHSLRLEVSGHDTTYAQPNRTPFALEIDRVELRVPISQRAP